MAYGRADRLPETMIDAWWMQTFSRPAEESDNADLPRIFRALAAQRLYQQADTLNHLESGAHVQLLADDPELFEELVNAKHND